MARALLKLVRPLNAVMAWAGVALGAWLAGPALAAAAWAQIALAATAATLVGMGANALNDALDVRADRLNRPERPVASGRVSVSAARVLGGVLLTAGVALALGVSLLHGVLAAASAGALVLYNSWLKRWPVVGNLLVALVLGLAVVFGALVVAPWPEAARGVAGVGALFAIVATWAREAAKDLEDVDGDAAAGAHTLPIVAGAQAARGLTLVLTAGTLALIPLASLVPRLGTPFLLYALPAAAVLLLAGWLLLRAPADSLPREAGRSSRWLKGAMALGMAALALAA